MMKILAQALGIAPVRAGGLDLRFDPNDFGGYLDWFLDSPSETGYDCIMTNNDKGTAPQGNAAAVARYAAETNSMTFLPPAGPARRSGKVRKARHARHRSIR